MKERIQIDGVWYVRETESQPEFIDVEINTSISALYENDDYCWEAIKLINDDGTHQDDIYVEFTDKNKTLKKIDYWDNMLWIKGVYEYNPDSIEQASEMMSDDGILHFRSFLNELKKIGWF
jgi:superfamily I DNA and RNA helicase